MTEKILLGFEVGSGDPVYLPLHHTAFTGMTGLSGKTTANEAISVRSGIRTLTFLTKRGEKAFRHSKIIPLFFKERCDWRYVESLIEAELTEDQRFNRSWIIKVCRGAKSLRDVWNKVKEQLPKARKDSLSERVYTCLNAYFEIIIPSIEKYDFSDKLEISQESGSYVMGLIGMPETVQAVIIRSVLEEILEHETDVWPTIPEAWKFIGETHTPVTQIAIHIIKQGYAVNILLFIDSQDIASINPKIRGQIDNWVLGRQKYEHEIERTLKAIPLPKRQKPKVEQIMTLKLGHFIAACRDWTKTVYVLPAGVPKDLGRKVAVGELTPEHVRDKYLIPKLKEDDLVYKEKWEEETRKRERLEETRDKLLEEVHKKDEAITKFEETHLSLEDSAKLRKEVTRLAGEIEKREADVQRLEDELKTAEQEVEVFRDFKAAFTKILPMKPAGFEHATPSEIAVQMEQPALTLETHRKSLTLSQSNLEGRIAIVYGEGLLPSDKAFTTRQLNKIMEKRFGHKEAYANFPKVLANFVAWGFFEKVRAGKRWDYKVKMDPEKAKEKGLLIIHEIIEN